VTFPAVARVGTSWPLAGPRFQSVSKVSFSVSMPWLARNDPHGRGSTASVRAATLNLDAFQPSWIAGDCRQIRQ
jgi:hypothetical protein